MRTLFAVKVSVPLTLSNLPGVGIDDGHADAHQAAVVVARVVVVEQQFGQIEVAGPGRQQLLQGSRIERRQRDETADLEAACVLLEIGGLHQPQVVIERFAGQQSLAQAVPVAELDEGAVGNAELEAVAAFELLAQPIGEPVALEIDVGQPARPSSRRAPGW